MIQHLNDLQEMETRYRANFVNSLSGFKSLSLIGTRSVQGNNNLSLVSSVIHLGSDPALCGFVIRPNIETENTLGNIVQTRVYTINHVQKSFYMQAHQCSAKYPPGVSEFDQTGLHPAFCNGIAAPFVAESSVRFACHLLEKIDIQWNKTYFLIGQIIYAMVDDAFVSPDGFIDLQKAATLTVSGLDGYHSTTHLARLSYAKVGKPVTRINSNLAD